MDVWGHDLRGPFELMEEKWKQEGSQSGPKDGAKEERLCEDGARGAVGRDYVEIVLGVGPERLGQRVVLDGFRKAGLGGGGVDYGAKGRSARPARPGARVAMRPGMAVVQREPDG